jgi:hypothetical protein
MIGFLKVTIQKFNSILQYTIIRKIKIGFFIELFLSEKKEDIHIITTIKTINFLSFKSHIINTIKAISNLEC